MLSERQLPAGQLIDRTQRMLSEVPENSEYTLTTHMDRLPADQYQQGARRTLR